MSTLRDNARVTYETSVPRLEGDKIREVNLRHPRTERVIGNREKVTFRIFNDGSQTGCYQVNIEDGGSTRINTSGVASDEILVGYLELEGATAPLSIKGNQIVLGEIDVPAGGSLIVRLDPHMCCVIEVWYEWLAGSIDPRLTFVAPPPGAAAIDVTVTHPKFDEPLITRPGWTPRT